MADPQGSFELVLAKAALVPVLTIERPAQGVSLARALVAGGLPVIEIVLRSPAALDALRAIADAVPDAVAGAGTVLSPRDLERAFAAGARFAVSPGATPELLEAAATTHRTFLPGVTTPSEMMRAQAAGFTLLKFFPAQAAGGIQTLKAVVAPFPHLQFCPTGGIREDRLAAYLALPNVLAVGGSWIAPAGEIAAGDWQRITERARRARRLADSSIRPPNG